MSLPPEVYRDRLAILGNGYALYEPDPGGESHVQVGDVGYIDPSMGRFQRLFNAFHDDEAPINKLHGVPENHEPLPDKMRTTFARAPLPRGSHRSKNVRELQAGLDIQGWLPLIIFKFIATSLTPAM